ncbi:MAG: glycosyltransferase family 4 protein [Lachnospiraceae bacterium]|nr:glycosyltransferase family 4 protein [Lachnospiraceae bacterium]
MKILFVTYCRAMLGANRSLVQLMIDLREQYDVEPYVLMPTVEDGSLHEELERLKIPYFIHPMKAWVVSEDARLRRLRGIKACIENRKYLKEIMDKIVDKGFDLIYSNNSTIQIGADLAKRMKLPHIWHVREYGNKFYHIVFSYTPKAVKAKFDAAAAVIAVSKGIESYIKESISPSAKTICIYDGIYSRKTLRSNWNDDQKLNFCYVGALQDGKNQLELLKAVDTLLREKVTDFHVTLVGEGKDYEKKLREYCKSNNLDSYVTFAGYCSDVMKLLDEMDVGVICSQNEAYGRVTVEYLLSSMPVIGAKGSGTSEIMRNENTGYLYQGGEVDQLAGYMKKMIMDRALVKEMGQNAYVYAKANFKNEKTAEQIYQVIKQSMIL